MFRKIPCATSRKSCTKNERTKLRMNNRIKSFERKSIEPWLGTCVHSLSLSIALHCRVVSKIVSMCIFNEWNAAIKSISIFFVHCRRRIDEAARDGEKFHHHDVVIVIVVREIAETHTQTRARTSHRVFGYRGKSRKLRNKFFFAPTAVTLKMCKNTDFDRAICRR